MVLFTNKTESQDIFSKKLSLDSDAMVALMGLCTLAARKNFRTIFIMFLAIFSAFNL